jgi:hypothetical protein
VRQALQARPEAAGIPGGAAKVQQPGLHLENSKKCYFIDRLGQVQQSAAGAQRALA